MATTGIIITTKDGEVIPAIHAESFGLAVQSMEKLNEEMTEIEVKAKELPKRFEDKTTYDRAAALIAQKKSVVKISESTMTPFTELAKKVTTFINTQKNIVKNHGEQVTMILSPAMAEYDDREAKRAREEQERLQKEKQAQLDREAEERRQKDAAAAEERKKERIDQIRSDLKQGKITNRQAEKFLREAGAQEEADKAKASVDEEDAKAKSAEIAAKLKVKPNTGAVAGIVRRTNYTAECVDPAMFKAAMMIAYEKKDFPIYERLMATLEVSDQKLGAAAREIQDDAKMEELYPFVKASHTKTF